VKVLLSIVVFLLSTLVGEVYSLETGHIGPGTPRPQPNGPSPKGPLPKGPKNIMLNKVRIKGGFGVEAARLELEQKFADSKLWALKTEGKDLLLSPVNSEGLEIQKEMLRIRGALPMANEVSGIFTNEVVFPVDKLDKLINASEKVEVPQKK
jgi:hypothetical protein